MTQKKRKSTDLNKTLEQLENDYWPTVNYQSDLIEKCSRYRKVRLKELTIENLRLLIGQSIGLEYLIPLAIDQLIENVMAEGDYYEGDLLKSVLKADKEYWKKHRENYDIVIAIVNSNLEYITNHEITPSIKMDILKEIDNFKKMFD